MEGAETPAAAEAPAPEKDGAANQEAQQEGTDTAASQAVVDPTETKETEVSEPKVVEAVNFDDEDSLDEDDLRGAGGEQPLAVPKEAGKGKGKEATAIPVVVPKGAPHTVESEGDSSDDDVGFEIVVRKTNVAAPTAAEQQKRFLAGTNIWVREGLDAANQQHDAANAPLVTTVPAIDIAWAGMEETEGDYPPIEQLQRPTGRTAFDINIDELEDWPWRRMGADLSDYFNYGFTEDTWYLYSLKQLHNRYDQGQKAKAEQLKKEQEAREARFRKQKEESARALSRRHSRDGDRDRNRDRERGMGRHGPMHHNGQGPWGGGPGHMMPPHMQGRGPGPPMGPPGGMGPGGAPWLGGQGQGQGGRDWAGPYGQQPRGGWQGPGGAPMHPSGGPSRGRDRGRDGRDGDRDRDWGRESRGRDDAGYGRDRDRDRGRDRERDRDRRDRDRGRDSESSRSRDDKERDKGQDRERDRERDRDRDKGRGRDKRRGSPSPPRRAKR
ncbi:unnamed protein product, partial [Chrysoparadoxa australica]